MKPKLPPAKTIDEYISRYPATTQAKLKKLRKLILEEVPDAQESISYAIPAFTYHGRLIYFAAYEKHISIYPFPSGDERFQKLAEGYKTSKGTIQFPHDKQIDYDLMREIVRYRKSQNLASKQH